MEPASNKRKLDRTIIQKLYHDVPSKDPTRESFLNRLKTFDVINWSGKPIDPPQCAKYGWVVAEKNVLKCVMCQQFLSVELPSPSKHESYKTACSKLRSRLTTAHSKCCLYSKYQTPDSVLEIDHLSNAELHDTIQDEVEKYEDLEVSLKFERLEEIADIFAWFTESNNLKKIRLSSFVLAITGWEVLTEDLLVKCNYCNRKWSLEPFLVAKATTPDLENDTPTKVDPVSQHQRWCAWRLNAEGWESRLLQLQQLRESRSQKKTRLSSDTYASLTDGMRAVRKLLNGTI